MLIDTEYEVLPADTSTPSHTEVRIESAMDDKYIVFSAPGALGILDAVTQVYEAERAQREEYGVIGDVHQWPIYRIHGIVRAKEAD